MSPYSSLNNTGIYDSGFASSKAGGFDTVSQVDRWLKNVEYNLDQTEQAVQQKGASTSSRVVPPPPSSNGFATQGGYANARTGGLNGRRYSNGGGGYANANMTPRGNVNASVSVLDPTQQSTDMQFNYQQSQRSWSNNENIHSNYSSYSGSKGVAPGSGLGATARGNGHDNGQKKAILRNQTGVGSLQRSQSLGRGQLASSLANLKARMGSRGSSRESSLSRLSNHSSGGGGGGGQTMATSQMHQQISMRRTSSRASSSSSSSGSSARVCAHGHHHHGNACGHGHASADRQKQQLQRSISEPSHHFQHHQKQKQKKQPSSSYSTMRMNAKSPPAPVAAPMEEDLSMMDPNSVSWGMGGFGSDLKDAAASSPSSDLHQCPTCSRTFNSKALEKHLRICQKVFQSKRPKFNAKGARTSGLEKVDDYSAGSSAQSSKSGMDRPIVSKHAAKPKWKQKSEQFRAAMMATRGEDVPGSGGYGGGGGAPVDDGLIPCPHCGRTFNETAAERHIARCKDIKARPKTLKAGAGRTAGAYSSRRSASRTSSYGRF